MSKHNIRFRRLWRNRFRSPKVTLDKHVYGATVGRPPIELSSDLPVKRKEVPKETGVAANKIKNQSPKDWIDPKFPIHQLDVPSCTACASALFTNICMRKQATLLGDPMPNIPSKDWFYYFNRVFSFTKARDDSFYEPMQFTGAYSYSAMQVMAILGGIPDSAYNLDDWKAVPPTVTRQNVRFDIGKFAVIEQSSDLDQMFDILWHVLKIEKLPIYATVGVFRDYSGQWVHETTQGEIRMPLDHEDNDGKHAYHAIVILDIDPSTRRCVFMNSWGYRWGFRGLGSLPLEYLSTIPFTTELYTRTFDSY